MPNTTFWPLIDKSQNNVGKVTSAVYSPRLEKNIALAMVNIEEASLGNGLQVDINDKFFDSLNYVFPKLNKKELTKKSPIFGASDPIIETCIKLLELSIIDSKEAIAYINNLDKKFFTNSQKETLLDNIKQFEQTNL